MSGYAASARIHGVTPRLAGSALAFRPDGPPRPSRPEAATIVALDPEDVLPGPTPTIAERWDAVRERWSQLTFYLFDAESWR